MNYDIKPEELYLNQPGRDGATWRVEDSAHHSRQERWLCMISNVDVAQNLLRRNQNSIIRVHANKKSSWLYVWHPQSICASSTKYIFLFSVCTPKLTWCKLQHNTATSARWLVLTVKRDISRWGRTTKHCIIKYKRINPLTGAGTTIVWRKTVLAISPIALFCNYFASALRTQRFYGWAIRSKWRDAAAVSW